MTNKIEADETKVREGGFILLYRSLRKHWIWNDPVKFQWWCDLLMEANHEDRKVLIGGQLIECKRGQSINSLQTWAKRWGTNRSMVLRFLRLLKNDEMIRTENVHKTTRISISNYALYNDMRNKDETKMKRKRNASETRADTNKPLKKPLKKQEKGDALPSPPSHGEQHSRIPELDEVRRAFVAQGGTVEMADKFYADKQATGWKHKGSPIVNYTALVGGFIQRWREYEPEAGKQQRNGKIDLNKAVYG